VYVDRDHRSRGVGRMLVEGVMERLEPIGLSRVLLATRDAHDVYAQFGFEPLPNPEIFMIKS
jgi:GNAT superfamily N-acetyltransferase